MSVGEGKHSAEVVELLSAYVDGELSLQEKEDVEKLLREDKNVSAMLGEIEYTKEAISALPRLRAPRPFTLSERSKKRRFSGKALWRLVLPAVAVMLMVAASWGIFAFMHGGMFASKPRPISQNRKTVATPANTLQAKALSAPEREEKKSLGAGSKEKSPVPTNTMKPRRTETLHPRTEPVIQRRVFPWLLGVITVLAVAFIALFLSRRTK